VNYFPERKWLSSVNFLSSVTDESARKPQILASTLPSILEAWKVGSVEELLTKVLGEAELVLEQISRTTGDSVVRTAEHSETFGGLRWFAVAGDINEGDDEPLRGTVECLCVYYSA
jgi:hypothetical protein